MSSLEGDPGERLPNPRNLGRQMRPVILLPRTPNPISHTDRFFLALFIYTLGKKRWAAVDLLGLVEACQLVA